MCSKETEKRLSRLLMILAEGERTIEISRKVLSELKEFEPFTIFKNLDGERKNKIDSYNIIYYLQNKGIYVSEQEAQLIILFYDQDFDSFLSYSEFINLIQSENNPNSSNKVYNKEISFNVDYSFVKLLEKEVELARKFLYALKDLKCRYDFNIHNIYHSIKSYSSITPDSIRLFLKRNEISYLDSDIKFIIKRLDLNKDGKIDLYEFHSLFGFPECSLCCPCINCTSCDICYCDSYFCDNASSFYGQTDNNDLPNKAYHRRAENNLDNNNNFQKNKIVTVKYDSPLKDSDGGSFELALKVMAITRIMLPDINIPATTAMETLNSNGRIIALNSGANVVMPNVTTSEYREKYEIYPNKICIHENPDKCRFCIEGKIKSIGRTLSNDYGNHRK